MLLLTGVMVRRQQVFDCFIELIMGINVTWNICLLTSIGFDLDNEDQGSTMMLQQYSSSDSNTSTTVVVE